jgi:hypothetical protein
MASPFTKQRLLAVEGNDEVNFFEVLLTKIGIFDNVDIRAIGGKDQFKVKLPAFRIATGFNSLEKIAIIRDADDNANNTFKSVIGVLKSNGLKPPRKPGEFTGGNPSVGVFIIPDNSSEGMLEDLCLETVQDHPAIKCVDTFINCTQDLSEPPKNVAKARVQAYLAAKPTIAPSLGVGAQKGYWDFTSENLRPLIYFLEQLK